MKRRRPLAVARALLGTQLALMLEYRAEILLWALSGLLPLIMYALWSDAAAGRAAALSPAYLARYFLAVFVVRQFSVVWVVYAFEEDHLLGRISPYLLQPLPLIWRYVAAHLAEQITRIPFVLLLVGGFLLLVPAAWSPPGAVQLLLTILAAHLAFWINFLMQYAITMLCFWTEKASALERLLFIPILFLSGLLAPLTLYPDSVRRFAEASPFAAMVFLPAQLAAGGPLNVGRAFAIALAWLALLVPLNLLLWRLSVRRYGAMGG